MSLRLSAAAIRTYDALKARPNARPRKSDARDKDALEAIHGRLGELISSYRLGGHPGPGGQTYVFWTEVLAHIQSGVFDDLLDRL
jgi:hypothetical protein